eukprot:scaffold660559_cov38-Prasinocladus_malaysianus.AAC.1
MQPADRDGLQPAGRPAHPSQDGGGRRLAHRREHRPTLGAHVDRAVVGAGVEPAPHQIQADW